MKQQVVEPSSGTYKVTEDLHYDPSFGNIDIDTITGLNMTARQTKIGWSPAGQFPVTIYDPMSTSLGTNGYKEVRGYDYDKGVLTSDVTQSYDGSTNNAPATSWAYDDFARPMQVTRPDGTYTTTDYTTCGTGNNWCGTSNSSTDLRLESYIKNYGSTGGSPINQQYQSIDGFGRARYTKHTDIAGAWTIEQTIYDSLGRVYQQSVPYQSTAYFTTNTYDTLNRVTLSQRPVSQSDSTAQNTTNSYKGRTVITTDPLNKVSTKIFQVTGALGRSVDHNNYYQDFAYDAFGSVLTVKDSSSPVNTLFSATYDYGLSAMQRTTSDIDRGNGTYAYDALGELKSSTDAKNQTVTFSSSDLHSAYDPLGRPITRTEKQSTGTADLTTTWTWGIDSVSHNIGQLQTITGVGAATYTEAYTFDTDGRPIQIKITPSPIGDQTFTVTYVSTTGLLATLTYPTSTNSCRVKISYGYINGFLKSLTDASNATDCGSTGTVFWTANTVNAMGEVTQETLGNGVVTNRAFDGVTGWMSTDQAGVGGGTALLNQSYLYDLVGNVTQRKQNNAPALTESACYDNLYRLDHTTASSVCTGATSLLMTYDAMGDITSRSDVNAGAAWTYDSVHKHQVKTAGAGNSYTYDANGNMSTRNGNSITWSSYNYPLAINATGESTTFDYGPGHQYWRQSYSGPNGAETTYYLGKLLERVDTSMGSDYRHYIVANGESVASYSRTSAGA
ncbi:MAG: hypothetical protein ACREMY_00970, partial [bacterium]